jgi:hypothetical protein
MNDNLAFVVSRAKKDCISWDYHPSMANADWAIENCGAALFISEFSKLCTGSVSATVSLGLLIAFAARRSLVCWFVYCEATHPLMVVDQVIEYWLDLAAGSSAPRQIDESWLVPATPKRNGREIVDCRWQDTHSASAAVASAARFAKWGERSDATACLSAAHCAWDISPAGGPDGFEQWLVNVAAPCAIDRRRMTVTEQFAYADFVIPEVMRTR